MKTFSTKILIPAALAICFMAPGSLSASSSVSAASFLKLPVNADSMALGGSAVALGSGISAVDLNPAALANISAQEFQTSYGTHLGGYSLFNAAYGRKGELLNLGLGVTRMAAADFEGRDEAGGQTGGFGASDMAVNLSLARAFDGFSMGMNVKYITSSMEKESASAVAFDVGVVLFGDKYGRFPSKLGLSVRNIGAPMKYMDKSEPLPLTVSAALAIAVAGSLEVSVNLSDNLPEKALEFGFGMGFKMSDSFSLNGGLARELDSSSYSSALPFKLNAGIGFKVSDFMINYGFTPLGELGNAQRMTLAFKFGSGEGYKMKKPAGKYAKSAEKKSSGADYSWYH